MSNKKSLGSSPIGLRTQGTMSFIPDLGVSKSKKADLKPERDEDKISKTTAVQEKSPQKKTVSYYLEEDLIEKVKRLAGKKDMCYSALVSNALQRWIVENG